MLQWRGNELFAVHDGREIHVGRIRRRGETNGRLALWLFANVVDGNSGEQSISASSEVDAKAKAVAYLFAPYTERKNAQPQMGGNHPAGLSRLEARRIRLANNLADIEHMISAYSERT